MLLFPVKASTVSFRLLNLDWSIQISEQLNVRKVIIKKNITKNIYDLVLRLLVERKKIWGGVGGGEQSSILFVILRAYEARMKVTCE